MSILDQCAECCVRALNRQAWACFENIEMTCGFKGGRSSPPLFVLNAFNFMSHEYGFPVKGSVKLKVT
jgi:hypothetical protein